MALTDSAIRALKPRERAYKVADEKGLYLQVTPAGGRLWRLKFRTSGGVEKKLSVWMVAMEVGQGGWAMVM